MITEFSGKKRKTEIIILMKENQTAILHFYIEVLYPKTGATKRQHLVWVTQQCMLMSKVRLTSLLRKGL